MSALSDFKAFIAKGNVIDMAVGIVIGLAFTAVVNAVVQGLILPLVSVPGHTNIAGWSVQLGGGLFLPGSVLEALITFVIIALVVFFGVVRPLAQMAARKAAQAAAAPATTKTCPECLSTDIPVGAKKCKYCASALA
jgi:large conductance mechanosensitive channel